MQKYEFMKRMLEETQPTMLRLSKKTRLRIGREDENGGIL